MKSFLIVRATVKNSNEYFSTGVLQSALRHAEAPGSWKRLIFICELQQNRPIQTKQTLLFPTLHSICVLRNRQHCALATKQINTSQFIEHILFFAPKFMLMTFLNVSNVIRFTLQQLTAIICMNDARDHLFLLASILRLPTAYFNSMIVGKVASFL